MFFHAYVAMSNIGSKLRLTPKGQLQYDRTSLEGPNSMETINNICSQVVVVSVSPSTNESSTPIKLSVLETPPQTFFKSLKNSLSYSDNNNRSHELEHYHNDIEIMDYEIQRQQNIEDERKKRCNMFNKSQQIMRSQGEQKLKSYQDEKIMKEMKILEEMKLDRAKELENISNMQKRCQEDSKQHSHLLQRKIKDAEEKYRKDEEKKKALELERLQKLTFLKEGINCTGNILDQIDKQINNCEFKNYLNPETLKAITQLKESKMKMKEYLKNEKNDIFCSNEEIMFVKSTVSRLQSTLQILISEIDIANTRGQAEKQKKVELNKKDALKSNEIVPKVEIVDNSSNSNVTGDEDIRLHEYIAADSVKTYMYLQDNLKSWQESFQPFLDDKNMKKLRFVLQKSVNTTVNTIGKTSGSHLKDKLNRLFRLLSGGPIEVDNKTVSANDHKNGLQFCKELLAKKLVRQGEDQVASNHNSAFAFAAVIVAMSEDFPDVGDLILAYFHQRCPYLVPYYIPKQEDQSDEQHYRALGYIYNDNVVEKQDKFLKRMGGIVRLYAAIIVSSTPPKQFSQNINQNRHGLKYGWMWLTRVLNLEPRPDITSTILCNFFEVAGNAMSQVYGKQFQKLLHCTCTEYFPKIKAITPGGSSGPLLRLEKLLENAISKQGYIPPPEGQLNTSFWST